MYVGLHICCNQEKTNVSSNLLNMLLHNFYYLFLGVFTYFLVNVAHFLRKISPGGALSGFLHL